MDQLMEKNSMRVISPRVYSDFPLGLVVDPIGN